MIVTTYRLTCGHTGDVPGLHGATTGRAWCNTCDESAAVAHLLPRGAEPSEQRPPHPGSLCRHCGEDLGPYDTDAHAACDRDAVLDETDFGRCRHCGVDIYCNVDGHWLSEANTSYYCHDGTHDDPRAQVHEPGHPIYCDGCGSAEGVETDCGDYCQPCQDRDAVLDDWEG